MENSDIKYASIVIRLLSFLIDIIYIYFISFIFYILLPTQIKFPIYGIIFSAFLGNIYFTLTTYFNSFRSIGARLFKLKVISVNGSEISFYKSILRSALIMIIALPYGFSTIISLTLIILSLLLLINGNKNIMRQTIWDIITKTCVIKLA